MCEWTPEYECHKKHLSLLRYQQQLEMAQSDVVELCEELERKRARVEVLKKRIEEIK
jgi:hypothetical protein